MSAVRRVKLLSTCHLPSWRALCTNVVVGHSRSYRRRSAMLTPSPATVAAELDGGAFYRGLVNADAHGSALIFASDRQLQQLYVVCYERVLWCYIQSCTTHLLSAVHNHRPTCPLRISSVVRSHVSKNSISERCGFWEGQSTSSQLYTTVCNGWLWRSACGYIQKRLRWCKRSRLCWWLIDGILTLDNSLNIQALLVCPAMSGPASLSVIVLSCNVRPCKFGCPSLSCPAISVNPIYVMKIEICLHC